MNLKHTQIRIPGARTNGDNEVVLKPWENAKSRLTVIILIGTLCTGAYGILRGVQAVIDSAKTTSKLDTSVKVLQAQVDYMDTLYTVDQTYSCDILEAILKKVDPSHAEEIISRRTAVRQALVDKLGAQRARLDSALRELEKKTE